MIGVKSYADKAIDAVGRNRAALERSIRRLADHDAVRPDGEDGEATFAWRRERRELEDRVEADQDALKFAERRAAEARVEAAVAAAKSKNLEMGRAARAAEKRVRGIFDLQVRLRDELAWLSDHVEEFTRYNADERGDLPCVADAERRVRERVRAGLPAIVQQTEAWVDRDGNHVSPQAYDAEGKAYWRNDVQKVGVTSVLREAVAGAAEMPDRICDVTRLAALDGTTIWPEYPGVTEM